MSNFENEKLTLILPAALAEKIHAALLLLIEKEETLVNQSNAGEAIDLVEEFMEVQSLVIERTLTPAVLQLKGDIKELILK